MRSARILARLGLALAVLTLYFTTTSRVQAAGSIITVTSTADGTLLVLDGNLTCDLREAIEAANTNGAVGQCLGGTAGELDEIHFDISTNPKTITLAAELDITTPVLIDGNTQTGYSGTPLIRLDGAGTTAAGVRFYEGSEGSTLRGMMVTGFTYGGVMIFSGDSSAHVTVTGNYIGTDGTNALGNGVGVFIFGGQYAQVGGLSPGERNIISGNITNVELIGSSSGPGRHATNNMIRGNYIGLNDSGTGLVSGSSHGITFSSVLGFGASNNSILFNTIAGGNFADIQILNAEDDSNSIQGNRIGTDASGSVGLGDSDGIVVAAGDDNVIGGNGDIGKRNLISGMDEVGILVTGGTGTVIADNVLGMNAAGTGQLANTATGIEVSGAGARIARNWIAGTGLGVWLHAGATLSSGSENNCITGNSPGFDDGGSAFSFENNWWGSASGPHNASNNPGGGGDDVTDNVDVDPWLASPAAICSAHANLGITSVPFGNQLVGTSRTQSFTVFSNGAVPLHFSGLGAPAAPFSVLPGSSTCSTSTPLGVGSSCQVAVKFAPTSTGDFAGSLTLASDSVPAASDLDLTGKGVAGTQLLKNASFETDANANKKPDDWTFANFAAATDKRDCTVHKSGACSLKFVGNNTQKAASQTILKNGSAGHDFTFSLWSRSASVPAGSTYRLSVQFYNGSTLLATKTKNFHVGTHAWQNVSAAYTTPGPYTKIVFKILFKAASGTAWFDLASLRWAN